MAGLRKPKEYDIKDSNVELIGTALDHQVKYNSALAEPAWHSVGLEAGLHIWRIEQFQVVPWPRERHGTFYDGDSFIVLHTYEVGNDDDTRKLFHDIFFWLGAHTSQDEAGTAAYKTVELDEFLKGAATQHRETQANPSAEFLELFPRMRIRRGGVESGFRRVEDDPANKEEVLTLLRVFKNPASAGAGILVVEVEPHWRSLDDKDVFVLDVGDKIWVWQGKTASPMERAKAAQVVHEMKLEKHVDAEVLAQTESRSRIVVGLLGGGDEAPIDGFSCPRPVRSAGQPEDGQQQQQRDQAPSKKLFRLSDASGQLEFNLVKDGGAIGQRDFDGNDVFLLDDAGKTIWVWEGAGASRQERKSWLRVAQMYAKHLHDTLGRDDAFATPIAKVVEGNESRAFLRAIAV
jgi:gelsolin